MLELRRLEPHRRLKKVVLSFSSHTVDSGKKRRGTFDHGIKGFQDRVTPRQLLGRVPT